MAASTSSIGENTDFVNTSLRWELVRSAFKCRIRTGAIYNTTYIDPKKFMVDAKSIVLTNVKGVIKKYSSVKVNTTFVAIFKLEDKEEEIYCNTSNRDLYVVSNLSNWYDEHVMERILARMEEFEYQGSGWKLHSISRLLININKYNPIRVGCNVEVPKTILHKKAVVNVKSDGTECFFHSVVVGLYQRKGHASRLSSYPSYKNVLKTKGLKPPITLNQIKKFEKDNDISVNVYGWKNQCVVLRLTPTVREKHVRLLMMEDQNTPTNNHFVTIANLSRLLSSQVSKNRHKIHICDRCLHYFISKEKLDNHIKDCVLINKCGITLPTEKDKWLKFKHYMHKERVPFVVYVDIECTLEKIEPKGTKNSQQYQSHKPFNLGYYVHCSYDESLCVYKAYRHEEDCVAWFAKEMLDLGRQLEKKFNHIKAMSPLTPEQSKDFSESPNCHICEKPFLKAHSRVKDHCHLTRAYRGPAHKGCNLNYKKTFLVPVVAHNMSGYDSHFLIEKFANAFEGQISVLAITDEKYKSFEKRMKPTKEGWKLVNFRFIDSLNFLNSSLDKLSSYLRKDQLTILRNQFKDLPDAKFDLLTRKGIFPYDYVSSYEILNEKRLPSREQFKSSLNDEDVSEDDYVHALTVWETFKVPDLGTYSDLYLKTDVLLLADVFENFRNSSIENYKLDPAHYYTLPGFTWDAMLKYTHVELELITDIDMLLFVEKGIRGGLSQCSHRQAEANNKYLPETYKPSEPSTYLMYYDMNNMYGWAMSEPLPYQGFRWLEKQELKDFNVEPISRDSSNGYLLEVDLNYPHNLHDEHADLPFCPSHDKPPGGHEKKLLATVYDKERYVIHYRSLQQCLQHGLQIKQIHRVLEFKQSCWLSAYIDLNTRLRTSATNMFQQNLFKLMNNAIYGKTMENVRNYVNVKLVTRWDNRYGAEDYISKWNFHRATIFSENFVALTLNKLNVVFNKPIYVGMCVLDISKMQLYNFHYDFMAKNLPGKCKILYTDTDSLIYELQHEDVYDLMKNNLGRFDTSNYKIDNQFNMPLVNEKKIGLMKDENEGRIMTTFVGLKAKVYSIRVNGVKEDIKKIKGIKRHIVKKYITHEDFFRCIDDDSEGKSITQNSIRSKKHCVHSVKETKQALSSYDDKRYIVPNSNRTLPWGHKDIPKIYCNNDSENESQT